METFLKTTFETTSFLNPVKLLLDWMSNSMFQSDSAVVIPGSFLLSTVLVCDIEVSPNFLW